MLESQSPDFNPEPTPPITSQDLLAQLKVDPPEVASPSGAETLLKIADQLESTPAETEEGKQARLKAAELLREEASNRRVA